MRSARPSPSKSIAKRSYEDGRNWVWPSSPAHAPTISFGARSPRSIMRKALRSSLRKRSDRRQSYARVAKALRHGLEPTFSPKSVSRPQIARRTSGATPNVASIFASSDACFRRSAKPLEMRAGVRENSATETLSSAWDRSRSITSESYLTPSSALATVDAEIRWLTACRWNDSSHSSKPSGLSLQLSTGRGVTGDDTCASAAFPSRFSRSTALSQGISGS